MPEIPNFPALCVSLAVEMTARTGELWRMIERGDNWPHIESPSACLSLRDDWMTHRLAIHATAPHGMREKTNGESITCDPKRTPEAIARDIEIRLLAHARAHLQESIQYDTQRRQEEAAANLRKNMIRRFTEEEYNGKLYKRSKDRARRMWIDINNYDHSATIEIHLPFADALQLLKQIEKGNYIK